MTKHFHTRPATFDDADHVIVNLRYEDCLEAGAYGWDDPTDLCAYVVKSAREIHAIEIDGVVQAIYGVTPTVGEEDAGRVWLLQTEGAKVSPRVFLTEGRKAIEDLQSRWVLLFNLKWGGNKHHLPWLERLGFIVIREIPGLDFPQYEFVRTQ